jgi:hypothetical protein
MDLFRQCGICFCISRIWTCSDSGVCFCFSRIWTCSDSVVCFCFSRLWIYFDSAVYVLVLSKTYPTVGTGPYSRKTKTYTILSEQVHILEKQKHTTLSEHVHILEKQKHIPHCRNRSICFDSFVCVFVFLEYGPVPTVWYMFLLF